MKLSGTSMISVQTYSSTGRPKSRQKPAVRFGDNNQGWTRQQEFSAITHLTQRLSKALAGKALKIKGKVDSPITPMEKAQGVFQKEAGQFEFNGRTYTLTITTKMARGHLSTFETREYRIESGLTPTGDPDPTQDKSLLIKAGQNLEGVYYQYSDKDQTIRLEPKDSADGIAGSCTVEVLEFARSLIRAGILKDMSQSTPVLPF